MRIGYACLALGVPGSGMKGCILKNATEERLLSLIENNLDALETLIDYNSKNGIRLFRISSALIPFGSSLARDLQWQDVYKETLTSIGSKIKKSGMRVSMHPGQYTVLNSPDEEVVQRAIWDLDYHANVLDCLGLGPEHKIILHLGGVYGNKEQALERFSSRYRELSDAVKSRLVIENDDRLFHIEDVLAVAATCHIPVVYDNLHNAVNPADKEREDMDWIKRCSETWAKADGPQKIHYSQQHPSKRPGAHSDFIAIDDFLRFYEQLAGASIDIMLEVKDKNLSALKCLHCTSDLGISRLETEWARYKYSILERSQADYTNLRKLLKDKHSYPAREMYQLIEASLGKPIPTGSAVNAAQHVWGYFKDKCSESERKRFTEALLRYERGETGLQPVKSILLTMARKYEEEYLLQGYYFYL